MKLGTTLSILLIVSFISIGVSLILIDFNTQYPEAYTSKDYIEGNFSFFDKVNSTATSIQTRLESLEKEEGGWKVFATLYVVPVVIIETIILLIGSIPFVGSIILSSGKQIGIPAPIIALSVLALIVSVMIMLIKFWHRPSAGV